MSKSILMHLIHFPVCMQMKMLKNEIQSVFTVSFVDDANTSKTCSKCKQQSLQNFLQVKNPRFKCQQQQEERKADTDPTYVKKGHQGASSQPWKHEVHTMQKYLA
jgi:Putative transposase DNA-binding domain